MKISIDIIIVNWNSGDFISECLDSIPGALNEIFKLNRVVVVDNNSRDGSLFKINKNNVPLVIIQNKKNLGFGKACNQGAKNSKADYLLFLNPDTRLFHNSLNVPLMFMENRENIKIGILGIKLVNEKGRTNRNCARFPTPYLMISRSLGLNKIFPNIFQSHYMLEWEHNDSRVVDQVMGSYYLIRRGIFNKLNGYDENFFVYYEDLDLALRTKELGFYSYYFTDAKVFHQGGGTTESYKAKRLFYNNRSKLYYAKKHFNYFSYLFVALFVLFVEPITRIILELFNFNFEPIQEIIIGYKMLWSECLQMKYKIE